MRIRCAEGSAPPVARDARLGRRLLAEQQVLSPPLEEQHSFSDTLVSHPNEQAQQHRPPRCAIRPRKPTGGRCLLQRLVRRGPPTTLRRICLRGAASHPHPTRRENLT